MSWTEVTLAYGTSKDFKRAYDKALSVFQGKRKQDFVPQQYESSKSLELCWERSYVFIPEKDFKTEYKVDPRQAGFKIDTLSDENNNMVAGVIIKDPNQKCAKLIARSVLGTRLADKLLQSCDAVRPQQGSEMAKWWETDLVKQRPLGITSPMSLDAVVEKVESHLADAIRKQKRRSKRDRLSWQQPRRVHLHNHHQAKLSQTTLSLKTMSRSLPVSCHLRSQARARVAKARARATLRARRKRRRSKEVKL